MAKAKDQIKARNFFSGSKTINFEKG